jgi:hypothetical protein
LSIVDESSHHEELIGKFEVISLENEKLKKYLKDATTKGSIIIERNGLDNEMVHDNERLKRRNQETQARKKSPCHWLAKILQRPMPPK